MNTFNGWIASLSNGVTVVEQPPIPGERSSWQKLLDELKGDLKISQLRLIRHGITIIGDTHRKLTGYCMAYESSRVVFRDTISLMQGIGSIYGDVVFMTWIDDAGNVRHDIRPLSEMSVHSTLRDTYVTGKTNST